MEKVDARACDWPKLRLVRLDHVAISINSLAGERIDPSTAVGTRAMDYYAKTRQTARLVCGPQRQTKTKKKVCRPRRRLHRRYTLSPLGSSVPAHGQPLCELSDACCKRRQAEQKKKPKKKPIRSDEPLAPEAPDFVARTNRYDDFRPAHIVYHLATVRWSMDRYLSRRTVRADDFHWLETPPL